MKAAAFVTPYLADLATLESYVATVLVPMRATAVKQIAGIVASSSGVYRLETLLTPARQIVAYVDKVLRFVERARVGKVDPSALRLAAEAVRSLNGGTAPGALISEAAE